MKTKLNFVAWQNPYAEEEILGGDLGLIKSLSFAYDGGRVYVSINGEDVFSTLLGGNDCQVDLEFEE